MINVVEEYYLASDEHSWVHPLCINAFCSTLTGDIPRALLSSPVAGLWLAQSDHVTWILASDWLVISPEPECRGNICSVLILNAEWEI